jgi:hypothetical protein
MQLLKGLIERRLDACEGAERGRQIPARTPLRVTGAEPQSSIFHALANTLPCASTAEILAVCVLTPRGRARIPAPGPLPRPAEKRCAAQAEYGRLAAQAYSPSDAMSQARILSEPE